MKTYGYLLFDLFHPGESWLSLALVERVVWDLKAEQFLKAVKLRQSFEKAPVPRSRRVRA